MANINKNFDEYFESIKNNTGKIGELKDANGKIVQIQEYKSQKSGKKSLKLTIAVDGGEVFTYLGFSNEKSIEITKARLTKLCIAAVGMAETKKIYEAAANDEDVDDDVDLILELGTKINKKLKKNQVEVVVTRTKTEDGFWDTRWHLPEAKSEGNSAEQPPIPQESEASAESTDEFLNDLKQ